MMAKEVGGQWLGSLVLVLMLGACASGPNGEKGKLLDVDRPEAIVKEPAIKVERFAPDQALVITPPANQFMVHRLWLAAEAEPYAFCVDEKMLERLISQQQEEVENGTRHRYPEQP